MSEQEIKAARNLAHALLSILESIRPVVPGQARVVTQQQSVRR